MSVSIVTAMLLTVSCGQETPTEEQEKLHPAIRQALEEEEGPAELEVLIQIASSGRPQDKAELPPGESPDVPEGLAEAHEAFLRFVEEEGLEGTFEPVNDAPFVTATLPRSAIPTLADSELVLFIGPHGERVIKDARER